jgi:hypothetical protein
MAEINLAEKYSKKVAERFSIKSITDAFAGKDYDFSGVKSIKIYSINTVAMGDYTRSGTDRFGELEELGDTVQEMVMKKDRSFTYSIDKGNKIQQFNIKAANASLKRQIDEVVTPELDQYRFNVWAAGAGLSGVHSGLTKSNIVETVMTAGAEMSNALVPRGNRVLFIKETLFIHVKLSDQITGLEKLGEKSVKDGSVGTLNGMKVVPVPDSYFPDGVNFIVKYKGATVDPVQLKTYRVLTEQRGVDGDVVEGRIIYDSFVLDTRAKGIYVSKNA